ncbi:MAG TPA: hypothetical protein DDX54_01425 [Rhodospirillaceae bacterium]|jgi:phosphohistidine phosphatase|nr:histidine phosphatase family protein [Alphaproteobacteria bacterium]HBH26054.1 hypothetical protein [Rhodospirillaceae bacterium]
MKHLFLLRHAHTLPAAPGQTDADRELAPGGVEAAARLGAFMRHEGCAPEVVLCSPAARTRQTLVQALGDDAAAAALYPESLYGASAGELLAAAQGADPGARSLLIVAHNPGIHDLARLMGPQPPPTALMAYHPGTLTAYACPVDAWAALAPHTGTLLFCNTGAP